MQKVAHLGRFDMAGEMSALLGGVRCASVRATTDLEALVLRRDDILAAMAAMPAIQEHLKLVIAARKANRRKFEALLALSELHHILRKRDFDARSRAISRAASRAVSRFQSRLPSRGHSDDEDEDSDSDAAPVERPLTDAERRAQTAFFNSLAAKLEGVAKLAEADDWDPFAGRRNRGNPSMRSMGPKTPEDSSGASSAGPPAPGAETPVAAIEEEPARAPRGSVEMDGRCVVGRGGHVWALGVRGRGAGSWRHGWGGATGVVLSGSIVARG